MLLRWAHPKSLLSFNFVITSDVDRSGNSAQFATDVNTCAYSTYDFASWIALWGES